ncbi:MAG: phosphopantothenoylcysteine decarboxylase / phosphopantothenate---cysteine ligase [Candidatus Atribacteria bacterium]|nr:phosphopantothenoylcysteine decarboxylase / phosphopantothenate---cysteine ligase [Candidatus Atribacteria bacterium]
MIVYHPPGFWKEKRITLGVSGGIAAFKVAQVVSYLAQVGARVEVVMTQSALQFVGRATFEALSGNPVRCSLFEEGEKIPHISIPRESQGILVAPATANILGKMARGIADDLLSTILLVAPEKVIVAPAMNRAMWSNPLVQENLKIIASLGAGVVEPEEGALACREEGKGRLPSWEILVESLFYHCYPEKPLKDKKVLVVAGATREWLDPVRFISNSSSGMMGCALAAQAKADGAQVSMVTGQTSVRFPAGVEVEKVDTATEMFQLVSRRFPDCDICFMVAAVTDYRPAFFSSEKIKKNLHSSFSLSLVLNPDILSWMGTNKRSDQIVVGFCAETNQPLEFARQKLEQKKVDLMVANLVGRADTGFQTPTNKAWIVDSLNNERELPLLDKRDLAREIIDHIASYFING